MLRKAISVPRGVSRAERVRLRQTRRIDILPYLMILPALLAIGLFSILPTLYGIVVSLYRVEFVELLNYVGLQNYRDVMNRPNFWSSVGVSFIFTAASVIFSFIFGFGLALLLNQRMRFRGPFRTIVLLPWVTSYVVTYLIFRWILHTDLGLMNTLFVEVLGWSRVPWLGHPTLALVSLIMVDVWRSVPYAMVLLLAGLQGISRDIYEAATIDGAGRIRSFFAITLQLMRPAILIVIVLMTITNFNVVVAMIVLTGGGPGNATEAMSLYMYHEAFTYMQKGTASAVAVIIFAINLVLTGIYIRLLRAERYT